MAALAHFTVHCSTAELPPDAGSAPETLPRGCLSRLPSATDHLQCRGMVYQCICAVRSLPVSLVGQDRWLSPTRPGFNSRTGKVSASRAPLAERSAVNRQVPGSIPGGGEFFFRAKNIFENISRCQNVFIDALGAGATHCCAFKKKKKKK